MKADKDVNELTEFLLLEVNFPVMNRSRLQLGVEQVFFTDWTDEENSNASILAMQFSNVSFYLGYALTTNVGFSVERRSFRGALEGRPTERFTNAFINVFGGLE